MEARELSLAGVWEFTPILRGDDRGVFLESFKSELFGAVVGRSLDLAQMNVSISRAGTVRGVHFADVPPGQAKYVQCFAGQILDIVVDIRVGSPTFGHFDAVELSESTRTGLFIPEGFGHAFCALSDSATVGYLCTEEYSPAREHGIHPLDPDLALPWPAIASPVLSPKDAAAPGFLEARDSGLLPEYTTCMEFMAGLNDSVS
ncbi:MAG: dTDP-4-dehydrorhamnose 3,5-epimerase [Candidatus Nanopelagicales bacterium]|nr:dTDP-4-dehydrorhamnose 3,5-epimerase [Candidatus Nanopelagicales bacterium]